MLKLFTFIYMDCLDMLLNYLHLVATGLVETPYELCPYTFGHIVYIDFKKKTKELTFVLTNK